ncbi:MAG: hypothetical protein RTU92_10875 [Candidatus Thorarchaeota archaeon]
MELVQNNLAAKLAEIDAEKADGITLEVPASDQYFNSTDDEVVNQSLVVYYGLTDGNPNSIGSATAEDNRYMFLIFLDELNLQPGIVRRKILRYIRAFKEIFEENFDRFPFLSLMKVQTIAPNSASWDENETSPVYKVGGVYIETSIV